ncbi:hypothetical protein WR25_20492 [Diploscapter pachys]|uniref:Uncharacterized protein n=1 Tax=Diploscapter pachys TaxID=2018661 RepID=A0A2A2JRR0_9BILA|nr:hypothetical protein WR25_20492 [Diploscapter pachys]
MICAVLVVTGRVVVVGCSTGDRGRIMCSVGVRPLSSPDDSSPEYSPDSSPEAAPLPANSIIHYFWLNLPTRFFRDGLATDFSPGSLAAYNIVWPVAHVESRIVDEVGRAVHHMRQTARAGQELVATGRHGVVAIGTGSNPIRPDPLSSPDAPELYSSPDAPELYPSS